eukprot:CAMPEP_0179151216 /NCGR_PEP_ID=MMETSP0796-20121207/73398_1 /TAXON_ID=73915 /ORGANISM="Pyrodinium bahamense, Strain pbaha01" /LENGTH=39 /DNA_ID= /DNA_START= /DNA_END= /DNA_ORIENTATION=
MASKGPASNPKRQHAMHLRVSTPNAPGMQDQATDDEELC